MPPLVTLAFAALCMSAARADIAAPGDVLVAELSAGIVRIEPTTLRRTVVNADLRPWELAFAPDGDLIAVDFGSVHRVDFETGAVTMLRSLGPGTSIVDAAVGTDGAVYLVEDAGAPLSASLFRVDPTSGDVDVLFSRIQCQVNCSRTRLSSLLLTAAGEFVVTLTGVFSGDPGYVLELDVNAQTSRIVSQGGLLARPFSIAEDADHSLLVTDRLAVLRIDPVTGSQTVVSQGGKLLHPYDLAVSQDRKIYLTELESSGRIVGGSQVVEIDPTTGIQRILARPLTLRGIAVVPGEPAPPACQDGIDNDGDHRRDYRRDRGCSSPLDGTEQTPCKDGIDNDGDGQVDYPADSGCAGDRSQDQEAPQCSDGFDNDGDGWHDYPEDPECLATHDNTEHWAPRWWRSLERREL
jgi:hypothetical protein